jgi:hypothetical protein
MLFFPGQSRETVMPWNSLLAGATGGAATFIVSAMLFGQGLINSLIRLIDTRAKQIELRGELLVKAMDGYDQQLSKAREAEYLALWALTAPVPKWPRNPELSFARLRQLTCDLRDWYFGGGGLYLSQEAREAYGAAQATIGGQLAPEGEALVPDDIYDAIQQALSRLRTTLTSDLATRRGIPALEAIREH